MNSTSNGTEPQIGPTLNGLNPEQTQPRRDSTPNRLNPYGLNSEWTQPRINELRMDWTQSGTQHRIGSTPKGTQPPMDWTQNGTQHGIDLTPNGTQHRIDSTLAGTQSWLRLNPQWTELRMGDSTSNSSQPRMAHNFNSSKKKTF